MSTVYILGAGASAGFDRSSAGVRCPSVKNFFTVADQVLKSDSRETIDNYRNLIFFLKKYFSLSPAELENAGLDMQDVLTFLDLEMEYSDSAEEMDLLQRARNEFMDLLSVTFGKVLDGPPCPYHGALASSLAESDTVISFNYDLLMDIALYLNSPYWEPGSGYGLRAVLARLGAPPPASGSKVLLLKPHGSFNWVVCRTCGNFYVLPFTQNSATLKWASFKSFFPEPRGHYLERLLIPPTLKKDIHGKAMQQIWTSALDALKNAHRIVVIGYSLPATDFLVKRLLYRSLPYNQNLCEFELVDRNNFSPANPLLEKYHSILCRSGNSVKVICDKRNIGEYSRFLAGTNKKLVKTNSKSDNIK